MCWWTEGDVWGSITDKMEERRSRINFQMKSSFYWSFESININYFGHSSMDWLKEKEYFHRYSMASSKGSVRVMALFWYVNECKCSSSRWSHWISCCSLRWSPEERRMRWSFSFFFLFDQLPVHRWWSVKLFQSFCVSLSSSTEQRWNWIFPRWRICIIFLD